MLAQGVQKGDTIIELVLAFAIFSLCAVTTVMILNKGVAVSQRSLEKSLVRQQVDSQSELIRYIHDTHNPKWTTLKSKVTTSPLPLTGACPTVTQLGTSGANGFYVVPDTANPDGFAVMPAVSPNYSEPATYARVDYTTKRAAGVWVQVALAENKSGNATINAYDFYVHGCWDSVGQTVPMTVGTIVRLYDN
jgi:type II secretory pathway pseudopilin PulG